MSNDIYTAYYLVLYFDDYFSKEVRELVDIYKGYQTLENGNKGYYVRF